MRPTTPIRLVLLAALAGVLALGCEHKPRVENHPLSVRAASKQLTDIPTGRISGKLRGETFRAADVRVRVETMQGRERVDLLVSPERLERCGLPRPSHNPRVWLRWKGTTPMDGAPVRVEPGQQSRLSVHYELLEGEHWRGHTGGAALVSLRRTFGGYEGKLWVCFDDGLDSCVSGSFRATECKSELDVDDSVWGAGRVEAPPPQRAE